MKKEYDFVFLTNTPSFYKLNLCNEIAKTHSLLLVLYGYGAEAVNKDLSDKNQYLFDVYFLHNYNSHKRNKIKTFIRLLSLMYSIKAKKVLYSGWIAPEYNIYSFLSPKSKNAVICESTIWESSLKGVKGWIKRQIINRMSVALPSGIPHKELFTTIGYKGKINTTGSVGIINKKERKDNNLNNPLKYIYVGRLIELKNISLIIDTFNKNGKPLTIVGKGELEKELKDRANKNIEFIGFVENEELADIYQSHDVFILPSNYEPWGLVVEEALYWGLPVIVSNKIGCSLDLVYEFGTGEIFQLNEKNSLDKAIEKIENSYNTYKKNVISIDWKERDRKQIAAYTSLIIK